MICVLVVLKKIKNSINKSLSPNKFNLYFVLFILEQDGRTMRKTMRVGQHLFEIIFGTTFHGQVFSAEIDLNELFDLMIINCMILL